MTGTGSQVWTQDSPGVPDTAESGDNFGQSLAAGDFDLGSRAHQRRRSAVHPGRRRPGDHVLWGAPLAAGDFSGNGVADLAVSATSEDVGSIVDAGAVSVLYGSAGGLTTTGGRLFTKDSPGIEGSASERDFFGHALTTGDTG